MSRQNIEREDFFDFPLAVTRREFKERRVNMRHAIAGTVLALAMLDGRYIRAQDQSLEFEAASIKVAPPHPTGAPVGRVGCYGGPGSRDPVRYVCSNATVPLMAYQAYDLKPYQAHTPETDTTFNVEAKVPLGATDEQVKIMLRNLLSRRFKLVFHYEKKEMLGYDLVVAKSGLKIKESRAVPVPASGEGSTAPASLKPMKDEDGFLYTPVRGTIQTAFANGLIRWVGRSVTVDQLAMRLIQIGRPVVDLTGLNAKYDFTLTFAADSFGIETSHPPPGPEPQEGGLSQTGSSGPTIFGALEKQLGLKAEPTKIMVDVFVIDHSEKTPVED